MQLTAIDGRRASVVLPNDPSLVDLLASNGVDISVSEGDQQNNYVALLGNLLFPLIAFAGLFFLFRRANDGSGSGGGMGGMGGMGGGPMDFAKSKSKFQEVPETGVPSIASSVSLSFSLTLTIHTRDTKYFLSPCLFLAYCLHMLSSTECSHTNIAGN